MPDKWEAIFRVSDEEGNRYVQQRYSYDPSHVATDTFRIDWEDGSYYYGNPSGRDFWCNGNGEDHMWPEGRSGRELVRVDRGPWIELHSEADAIPETLVPAESDQEKGRRRIKEFWMEAVMDEEGMKWYEQQVEGRGSGFAKKPVRLEQLPSEATSVADNLARLQLHSPEEEASQVASSVSETSQIAVSSGSANVPLNLNELLEQKREAQQGVGGERNSDAIPGGDEAGGQSQRETADGSSDSGLTEPPSGAVELPAERRGEAIRPGIQTERQNMATQVNIQHQQDPARYEEGNIQEAKTANTDEHEGQSGSTEEPNVGSFEGNIEASNLEGESQATPQALVIAQQTDRPENKQELVQSSEDQESRLLMDIIASLDSYKAFLEERREILIANRQDMEVSV
ncbi:hypothetical protein BJ508DRAFT_77789 [Ascobolus immersus RN42]|uniref:Uncharacterized protein n=1 Tax=Ascobolus immersus RN42 TaxID=1160509 RepID=A0A3N4IC59_ASCIM|nr:hypothetical protein BJ508DRAFT_77789 [Ascobolus immersus RN42]